MTLDAPQTEPIPDGLAGQGLRLGRTHPRGVGISAYVRGRTVGNEGDRTSSTGSLRPAFKLVRLGADAFPVGMAASLPAPWLGGICEGCRHPLARWEGE